MDLDDMLDQCQPKPRATFLADPPVGRPEKPIRQMGAVLGPDANAPVLHGYKDATPSAPRIRTNINTKVSFFLTVFYGIDYQVDQHLGDGVPVRVDPGQTVLDRQ